MRLMMDAAVGLTARRAVYEPRLQVQVLRLIRCADTAARRS